MFCGFDNRLWIYDFKQIEAIADYNTAVAWLKRLGSYNIEL